MMLGVGICKPQGESRLIQIGLTSKAQSRLVYFEVGHNMGELTTRGIQPVAFGTALRYGPHRLQAASRALEDMVAEPQA